MLCLQPIPWSRWNDVFDNRRDLFEKDMSNLECYKKNIIFCGHFTSGSYFCSAPVCFVSRTSKIYDIHKGFLVGSNLNFNNTIYFMPMIFEGDPRSGIAFEEIKYGNIPGIESVICPKTATVKMTGKYINVLLCDDSFISTFAPIDQGRLVYNSRNKAG